MPRKPIHLELSGGKSQRQRIWDAIRMFNGKPFTQMDVTPGGIPDDTARDFLRGLMKGGFLQVVQEPKHSHVRTQWVLANDIGAEAPRVKKNGEIVTAGKGNEAIWGAMQALGTFNARVLAEMSGSSEQTVKTYCKLLASAGYLTIDRQGKGKGCGGIQSRYRLLRSKISGPRPPMITRIKAVYDPNVHQIVWQQTADDALESAEAV